MDRAKDLRVKDLNSIMEFDRVIEVHADGSVTDGPASLRTPDLAWDGITPDAPWRLMTGYSGQHGYSGPVMHPSEYIGGAMEWDILDNPGHYVAIVVESDDDEPAGWAVAYIHKS